MRRFLALLFAIALVATACGGDADDTADSSTATDTSADTSGTDDAVEPEPDEDPEPEVEPEPEEEPEEEPEPEPEEDPNPLGALRVPEDYATIQEAVDAAVPGDLVLIGEGVYNESVSVETDNIVIRGVDRNKVILDGEHSEDLANGIIVFGNGVAVENLTVQNYFSNGVFFTGDYDSDFILEGYRVSYVTALNNRKYGIYAFNTTYGLIEHSYASGTTDSGFYVGQCQPCNALLIDNISEANALAYSGTNAGGDLYIINNEFRNNRAGVVPNTLDSEELAPQRGATFAGNHIWGQGNPVTDKGGDIWELMYGIGFILPGANENVVTRNLIENNLNVGLAISWLPDENIWLAENNRVTDNVFRGNPLDIGLVEQGGGVGLGNCFTGNTFETSVPDNVEVVIPCDAPETAATDWAGLDLVPPPGEGDRVDYTEIPKPGDQPTMPDALTTPPTDASSLERVDTFDLDAVVVPTGS